MPHRKTTVRAAASDETATSEALLALASGDGVTRHQRVKEAACLRAEARGFIGGDPLEDWLLAEAEIDQAGTADKQ